MAFCTLSSTAQSNGQKQAVHAPAWQRIAEKDVLWKRIVWRTIDANEKDNELFFSSGVKSTVKPFINVIMRGIATGKVRAYSADNDQFTTQLTTDELQKIIPSNFDIKTITRYTVKEHSVYDNSQKKMQTRILGIAPMQETVNAKGEKVYQPLFWAYYFDAADYFAGQTVANFVPNDGLTWFDVLEQRTYKSTIEKIADKK